MDENKISDIIKESVIEATAPIVEKVDGVVEKIEVLANRVNEQDVLIGQLIEDNQSKSQIITEQQAMIEELQKELEQVLSENEKLKAEKELANNVLDSVKDKLLISIPRFEGKDHTIQYVEIGELLSEVEFVPNEQIHDLKIENTTLYADLNEAEKSLSHMTDDLNAVKNENASLRQEIDRLISRAEKVMTATIDEPERDVEPPGKEEKNDVEIFER
jgi:ABC-type transporter Mla subunit MlaD